MLIKNGPNRKAFRIAPFLMWLLDSTCPMMTKTDFFKNSIS